MISLGQSQCDIVVLKFGSSVLRSASDVDCVVSEIYRHVREGSRVVAVVSAIGRTTDQLFDDALSISESPDATAHAALLATGELLSAATLHLALRRDGVPAALLDHHALGIRTEGELLHATPLGLATDRLPQALDSHDVVVVPGFVGVHDDGRTSLLGRGGSDLTAVALATWLDARRCILVKDVDGLYECDPNAVDDDVAPPRRFECVDFGRALELESELIQAEAIQWARDHNRPFEIAGMNSARGTHVARLSSRLAKDQAAAPLRVALLGCGAVGRVVFERLQRQPEQFQIVGVGVRRLERHRARGHVPSELLCDAASLTRCRADVLIELTGDGEQAKACIDDALRKGRHVITANKSLLAEVGDELSRRATDRGGSIRFSAAVGGGVPMLEAVRKTAVGRPIRRVRGVLNGTANFVLQARARGQSLKDALDEARRLGLAEADPSRDLNGLDAACKLRLLARAAFGADVSLSNIDRQVIGRRTGADGRRVVQVATLQRTLHGVCASVQLELLPDDDPLVPRDAAGNTLLIEDTRGTIEHLEGLGAGGAPTALSVIADLLELERSRPAANVSAQTKAEERFQEIAS